MLWYKHVIFITKNKYILINYAHVNKFILVNIFLVINFLLLFQRFDKLTNIITRRVRMRARTWKWVFARVCVQLRYCTYMCANVHVHCECARNLAHICAQLRGSACVCVRLASVRARVVDVHACARPCVCKLVNVCMCAFFREWTTLPGFRQLGKYIKIAINSLSNNDKVNFFSWV